MSNIILIQDLLDQRKRKEQELLFYSTKLAELEEKRNWVMKEIALTNKILLMIKNEKIVNVRDK
jgi:hypothetical protein